MAICTSRHHLAFRPVPIRVFNPTLKTERAERFVPAGNVERVCCACTQSAKPQRIERHIDSDQAIFRHLEGERGVDASASKHAQGEEKEGSAASSVLLARALDEAAWERHPKT